MSGSDSTKTLGIIGLGSMGANIARLLLDKGYSLVVYNKTPDKYGQFKAIQTLYPSKDISDFAAKLKQSGSPAIIWMMVSGGLATNEVVGQLSKLLRSNDIVIDASNSMYTDSMANYAILKQSGIFYLDVGCPDDLTKGVSLMVGGDKLAFERAEDIFKIVCGGGAYGYVGASGAGHMAKLVHNMIFYGIFPIYAEGIELLTVMEKENPGSEIDTREAIRLLSKSPPINAGIMEAISATTSQAKATGEAPKMGVSSMVELGAKKANEMGAKMSITQSILAGYASMSEGSRRIYGAAKKKLTGH